MLPTNVTHLNHKTCIGRLHLFFQIKKSQTIKHIASSNCYNDSKQTISRIDNITWNTIYIHFDYI